MGLETATYVSQLTATNPVSNDTKSQGDDHLRLLKAVLQATFPNASKAFRFPSTEVKSADFSVASTDQNKTFLVTTASAAVVMTLPSLTSDDAGWECFLIKTNTGTNAVFITPPSGTIQSGEYTSLAKARRVIPGRRTRILWTGSVFIAERVESCPIGTVKDFMFSSLPVGYEFPYGQTLSSASSNYPEFYAANASSDVMPDCRGRVVAGKDDMGGTSADRLTAQTGGINGDTLLAVGGAETHTLTTAQLASHVHAQTAQQPTLRYSKNTRQEGSGNSFSVVGDIYVDGSSGNTGPLDLVGDATPGNTASAGSDGAHNNVQPTIIFNKIVVVE